jgi:hypothetical protein
MPKIYGADIVNETSVGGGISAIYKFSTTTTITDPLDGYFRLNNATPASVTTIAISKIDSEGFTRDGLSLLRNGDTILFSSTHQSVSQAYELTAEPIDNTTWYIYYVTNKLTNGSFGNHDKIEVTAVFSGASKYTELTDVPQSFTGDAGKLVAVNSAESGLEHRILTATDIPNLSASKITSDLINPARLATGTANNTTYLRGDQTWQAISSGATVQTNPPTATTNATLGRQIYATSDNRLYLCIDDTTNANGWAYWNRSGITGILTFSTTGTPVNNASMDDASNQAFFRKGALYYLGTSGLTTTYSNVHTSGRCVATMSTVQAGSPTLLMDRTANQVYTNILAGSWMRFDFGSRPFIATRIVWQHGFIDGQYRLQNYKYQGSNDATTSPTNWTDIATYTSSPPANVAYSFKDDSFTNTTAFRHYRILSTGVTTSADHSFAITDLEFFGKTVSDWTF